MWTLVSLRVTPHMTRLIWQTIPSQSPRKMKIAAILKYVFALIGAGLLAGAMMWSVQTQRFLAEAVTAQGRVVELVHSRSSDSTTYRPVVRFTDSRGEEIEFTSSTGSNPPSYARGEQVAVLYLPGAPQDARINGFFSLWGGPAILGAIGSVFFLIGAGIILVPVLQRRRDEALKNEGTPVETAFQSVNLNTSYSVNGRHPFRILTQWQDPATSQVHVFHSRNLWFDPTSFINDKRITVYIARDNPKKYAMDVSFLPACADG
jgi:hypothetical protein